MFDRIREALIPVIILGSIQIFLVSLDVVPDLSLDWAYIPVLAMMIPQVAILSSAILGGGSQRSKRDVRMSVQPAVDATPSAQSFAATGLDAGLAAQVARVREYQREVSRLAKAAPNAVRADRFAQLSKQYDAWVKDVEAMAQRVQMLRANPLVMQDVKAVPESIRKLAGQLASETDSRVRQSLEQTLIARQGQMQSLEKLQATTRYAEVQLENTVASLGTIYSQALANNSTDQVADYQHLAVDVDERVRALQDELAAIEEVRLDRADRASNTLRA